MTLDQNETLTSAPQPEHKTACGGKIKDPSKYPSAEYRGEKIYFCTQACLEVFGWIPIRSWRARSNIHLIN